MGGTSKLQRVAFGLAMASITLLAACGRSQEPATPPAASTESTAQAPAAPPPPAASAVPQLLTPNELTWSPEAMEDLLAPVALYPDVVLGQVLVASTNPQEVLDAGNWLLQNQGLQANALDEAARQVGFTPPVRGLLQSPEVVDMMCSQLGWTTELGQAFVNDQQGALDAVQRLRAQAKDVGNLQSSDKMTVATETQGGQQVITVSPPSPQVVYVPQYDPVAAYAPPPAAPVTSTTTTTTDSKGHSTGSMVATGLLGFGAGILVANIFDDDDDDDYYRSGYYNPRYYGPPMPYYPSYPYRPVYGGGYGQSYGYNRPPNYDHSFNNNTIIVNQNNNADYWNRHGNRSSGGYDTRAAKSPITAAKPNRPELNTLNAQASQRPRQQAPAPSEAWKGQTSYAGAKQGTKSAVPSARPDAAGTQSSRDLQKPQGTYAGAKPATAPAARPATAPKVERPAAAQSAPRPASNVSRPATVDRGKAPAAPQLNKPSTRPAATPQKAPQVTKPAASPAKPGAGGKPAAPAAKPAKPAKPKSPPTKPKSVPARP